MEPLMYPKVTVTLLRSYSLKQYCENTEDYMKIDIKKHVLSKYKRTYDSLFFDDIFLVSSKIEYSLIAI